MTAAAPPASAPSRLLGRSFIHSAFDPLVIGAGLSAPVLALLLLGEHWGATAGIARSLARLTEPGILPWVLLVSTSPHFAASTVRLYTKHDAARRLPFLAYGFPLLCLALLTLATVFPQALGRHLQALYFTWSPYHYAAQGYGIAVMYAMRSGCRLDASEKRALHVLALAPFAYAFVTSTDAGLDWLLPFATRQSPAVAALLGWVRPALIGLGLGGPLALWLLLARRGKTLPLTSGLALLMNGVWWYFLPAYEAFVWATFFHAAQYLAIVLVFHVREQGATGHAARSAIGFYALCVALGYALFNCLPQAYAWAGFTTTESLLMVIAIVNLHHFIVDGFIWKLGRQDSNRAVVVADLSPPQAAGA
jgi:hypothetical protein